MRDDEPTFAEYVGYGLAVFAILLIIPSLWFLKLMLCPFQWVGILAWRSEKFRSLVKRNKDEIRSPSKD